MPLIINPILMPSFTDKIALITGAASGLGRATALTFARLGATVVVSDVNADGGAETVALIEEAGGKAVFIGCDVTNEADVQALVQQTVQQFGRLDCAVNNAGISSVWAKTHEYPTEHFHKVMEINTTGVFYCLKAEISQMLAQGGGNIVNVSSVSGLVGFPHNSAYTASKHAVVGLTRSAGLEYARKNIRVNAVCPAFTLTPMVEAGFVVEGFEEGMKRGIPMKRFGQPREIADAIVWLCSDESSFITGHALPLDGGLSAG